MNSKEKLIELMKFKAKNIAEELDDILAAELYFNRNDAQDLQGWSLEQANDVWDSIEQSIANLEASKATTMAACHVCPFCLETTNDYDGRIVCKDCTYAVNHNSKACDCPGSDYSLLEERYHHQKGLHLGDSLVTYTKMFIKNLHGGQFDD